MCIRLDIIRHWIDGRTDRRTEVVNQYRALHVVHAEARKIDSVRNSGSFGIMYMRLFSFQSVL